MPAAWEATSSCRTSGSPSGTEPTRENPPQAGESGPPGSPGKEARNSLTQSRMCVTWGRPCRPKLLKVHHRHFTSVNSFACRPSMKIPHRVLQGGEAFAFSEKALKFKFPGPAGCRVEKRCSRAPGRMAGRCQLRFAHLFVCLFAQLEGSFGAGRTRWVGAPLPHPQEGVVGLSCRREASAPIVLHPPTPSETHPHFLTQNCTPPIASGAKTHSGPCGVLSCGFHTPRVKARDKPC